MNNRFTSFDGYGLRYLPYHLAKSKQQDSLTSLLCDIQYLDVRCRLCDVHGLIQDYNLLPSQNQKIAAQYCSFLLRHAQRLTVYRGLLFTLIQHEGFPEAQAQAGELLRNGRITEPWLRLTPLAISSAQNSGTPGRQVILSTECALEAPVALDIAVDRSTAVFVKQLGQVGIIDLKHGREMEGIIVTQEMPPLALYCSADGGHIVIAYENGQADVIRLGFNSSGALTDQPIIIATLDYLIPAFAAPCMAFIDNELWYQRSTGEIARCSLPSGDGAPSEECFPLEMASGELSGIVPTSGQPTFLFRQPDGTQIVAGKQSGASSTIFLPRVDVNAYCTFGEGFAVAPSKRKLILFEHSAGLGIVKDIPLQEPAVCLAWNGRELIWVSETDDMAWVSEISELFACMPDVPDSLEHIRITGTGFTDPRRLCAHADGSFYLISRLVAVRFGIAHGSSAPAHRIHAVYQAEEEGKYLAIQERDHATWLLDGAAGSEKLIDAANRPSAFVFGVDGENYMLAAHPLLGRAFVFDPGRHRVHSVKGIPPNTTSIVGDSSSGFWLSDSIGGIYFLSQAGECSPIYDVGLEQTAQTQLIGADRMLIWSGFCGQQSRFGADMVAAIVFFPVLHNSRLGYPTKRIFTPEDGTLSLLAFDAPYRRLLSLWSGGSSRVRRIRLGTVSEYADCTEQERMLVPVDPHIRAMRVTGDGSSIYLLCNSGNLFRLDSSTLQVQAVFSSSTVITDLAQGVPWNQSQILIGNNSLLFACDFEGDRHVVS